MRVNRLFACVLFATCAPFVHANNAGVENLTWLEISSPLLRGDGFSVQVKKRTGYHGWAAQYVSFKGQLDFDSYIDRSTQLEIEPVMHVVGVSKFISAAFGWGYADFGVGLGIAAGEWGGDCDPTPGTTQGLFQGSSLLGTSYSCDLEKGTTFGIPVHLSTVLGRGVGLGLRADAFVSEEKKTYTLLSFTLPIGNFTQ